MLRHKEFPRNQGMSHLAIERQENITQRFTDDGHLLEIQN